DIAKSLSQDQALSIRVLRLANGTAYSRGKPVDTLKAAVGRIGVQEVRNLATAISAIQQYEGRANHCVDPRLFWEHSIACGLIASTVARSFQPSGTDDYFLWGVLHDFGRLVLLEHLEEQYFEVCRIADEMQIPLESAETRLLGINHCQVLESVIQHWQLPDAFGVPMIHHHAPA